MCPILIGSHVHSTSSHLASHTSHPRGISICQRKYHRRLLASSLPCTQFLSPGCLDLVRLLCLYLTLSPRPRDHHQSICFSLFWTCKRYWSAALIFKSPITQFDPWQRLFPGPSIYNLSFSTSIYSIGYLSLDSSSTLHTPNVPSISWSRSTLLNTNKRTYTIQLHHYSRIYLITPNKKILNRRIGNDTRTINRTPIFKPQLDDKTEPAPTISTLPSLKTPHVQSLNSWNRDYGSSRTHDEITTRRIERHRADMFRILFTRFTFYYRHIFIIKSFS